MRDGVGPARKRLRGVTPIRIADERRRPFTVKTRKTLAGVLVAALAQLPAPRRTKINFELE